MAEVVLAEFEFTLPLVMLYDLRTRAKEESITTQTAMRQALAHYLYQPTTKGDTQ